MSHSLIATRSTAPAPLLVTAREAARMLSVCERTLFAWTQEGRIPVVRLSTSAATKGRQQTRYAVADLHAFIDAAKSANDQRPA